MQFFYVSSKYKAYKGLIVSELYLSTLEVGVDQYHKALVQNPTIHHFGSEVCKSVPMGCIAGCGTGPLWGLWDWSIVLMTLAWKLCDCDLGQGVVWLSPWPGSCVAVTLTWELCGCDLDLGVVWLWPWPGCCVAVTLTWEFCGCDLDLGVVWLWPWPGSCVAVTLTWELCGCDFDLGVVWLWPWPGSCVAVTLAWELCVNDLGLWIVWFWAWPDNCVALTLRGSFVSVTLAWEWCGWDIGLGVVWLADFQIRYYWNMLLGVSNWEWIMIGWGHYFNQWWCSSLTYICVSPCLNELWVRIWNLVVRGMLCGNRNLSTLIAAYCHARCKSCPKIRSGKYA